MRKENIDKPKLMHRLRNLVSQAYVLSEEHKAREAEYEKEKRDLLGSIMDAMGKLGITSKEVKPNGSVCPTGKDVDYISCKVVEQKRIVYDTEAMHGKLDKELCNEIVDKQYEVSDMLGLVSLLKKHGVNPKDFKRYIIVRETVNTQTLNKLFEIGDVSLEDLDGCYTVTTSSPYLKLSGHISNKKGEDDC